MGLLDRFLRRGKSSSAELAAPGSYAALNPRAMQFLQTLEARIQAGQGSDAALLVKAVMQRQSVAGATVGIPDLGFKGARQQLFQRFNLIDLYGMSHNNTTVKTAILTLRHEVFRRGLEWEPAFAFRCPECLVDYSQEDQETTKGTCPVCDSQLVSPNPAQRVKFDRLMPNVNIYGQSLMSVLKSLEDDLNIADDAFLFLSSDYHLTRDDSGQTSIQRFVKQLFRLDPIFIEFDTDDANRPGLAHHLCLAHRDNLLEVPRDAGWEHEWKGTCPIDGYPTMPVLYRYVPTRGTYGAQKGGVGTAKDTLYLVKGEVIHASKFSPSELYGYSPLFAIYEKVLSLIGMDRYLYDYFFERKMPQGVITTVTDNPEALELQKEEVLAKVLADPHYLPWLAVSSRSGQGKTEFTRFAYSLDELQFLPVQEALARAVAGLYGIPDLYMGFERSYGGLGNDSQQTARMSRGAVSSQEIHNIEIIGPLLEVMGVTDWHLTLSSADDRSEESEWDLKTKKANWAMIMKNMGFGIEYDQDEESYTVTGEVKPLSEQNQYGGMGAGMGAGMGGGMPGAVPEMADFGGFGGGPGGP